MVSRTGAASGCGDPSAQFAEFRNTILQAVRRGQAEEEAQRAGDLHRSTFEHAGSATIIVEEDTTIALVNNEFEHLTGYSREEMEGKMSWTVFVAAGDIERLKNYHRQRRIDRESAPGTYEFRLIDRHGGQKDLHMTIGCIPRTDRTVASMLDISNRKRFDKVKASEASLAAQCRIMEDYQVNLRGIIDFLPDPTFVLGIQFPLLEEIVLSPGTPGGGHGSRLRSPEATPGFNEGGPAHMRSDEPVTNGAHRRACDRPPKKNDRGFGLTAARTS